MFPLPDHPQVIWWQGNVWKGFWRHSRSVSKSALPNKWPFPIPHHSWCEYGGAQDLLLRRPLWRGWKVLQYRNRSYWWSGQLAYRSSLRESYGRTYFHAVPVRHTCWGRWPYVRPCRSIGRSGIGFVPGWKHRQHWLRRPVVPHSDACERRVLQGYKPTGNRFLEGLQSWRCNRSDGMSRLWHRRSRRYSCRHAHVHRRRN